ncbi:hypothetical protein COL154_006106 [Colletotrichum chrysophilum]|nr:hypothetical protein COL154_006106 [Colletotrichum chrysophilum]
MAFQGLLPEVLAKCDDKGRPRWALFISAVVGVILSYLSLSSGGTTALNWFISITSASFFSNWAIIAFTNLRFHAALRAQNDKIFSQNFAWKSIAWPFAPIWGLIISSMLMVCLVYAAVNPSVEVTRALKLRTHSYLMFLLQNAFSAENFFEYMIGLLMIVGATIGYKLVRRSRWVDPAEADLVTGRHILRDEEIQFLNEYYSRPLWRRVMTYLSLV